MFTILLHSSKTMRASSGHDSSYQPPQLLPEAKQLAAYIKQLPKGELAKIMKLSDIMSSKTWDIWQAWEPKSGMPAIDCFIGDIYSGLQTINFSKEDRLYANQHLYIISGLYGVLRALDSVNPYRLELGYKLPDGQYSSLYKFWGDEIARVLPPDRKIVNLASNEYYKAVLPYLDKAEVISPRFLTINSYGKPVFVAVHAKIARGSFAGWLIKNQINLVQDLANFSELGYRYDNHASALNQPVFICQKFGGLGRSVRLQK